MLLFAARIFSGMIHPTVYRVCYYLFFFCVGMVICRKPELAQKKYLFAVCVVMSALLWYAQYHSTLPTQIRVVSVPMLALTISYLFIFVVASIKWKESGFMPFCGEYCLQIYLIHSYFTAGNRTLLPMLGITQPYVALAVNTISSFVISLGLGVVCNRISWTMVLFRPVAFIQKYFTKKQ